MADRLVANFRQIAQYPPSSPGTPTDVTLVQRGGLGGAYYQVTAHDLVAGALSDPNGNFSIASALTLGSNLTVGGTFTLSGAATLNGTLAVPSSISTGTLTTSNGVTVGTSVTLGRDPIAPLEAATAQYVTNNTVWSFNTRKGNVTLTWADIMAVGAANIQSPKFSGTPTVPDPNDVDQCDGQIANTKFVQAVLHTKLNDMLSFHPFVWSFQGRGGDVCLTLTDILNAGGVAAWDGRLGGKPTATTPPAYDWSDRIATTKWVQGRVGDFSNELEDLRRLVLDEYATIDHIHDIYAPLDTPHFTGRPTAPTPPGNSNNGSIATTSWVMARIAAAIAGVTTFNGRSGHVTFTIGDLLSVQGARTVSPAFTGVPTAPTAPPGTATTQLATTHFVQDAIQAASLADVHSFNGRTGTVVFTVGDLASVDGARTISPAFTGTPTSPTPPAGDNSTRIATTAFITSAINTAIGTVIQNPTGPGTFGRTSAGVWNAVVPAAGGNFTGDVLFQAGARMTMSPVDGTSLTNRDYVDGRIQTAVGILPPIGAPGEPFAMLSDGTWLSMAWLGTGPATSAFLLLAGGTMDAGAGINLNGGTVNATNGIYPFQMNRSGEAAWRWELPPNSAGLRHLGTSNAFMMGSDGTFTANNLNATNQLQINGVSIGTPPFVATAGGTMIANDGTAGISALTRTSSVLSATGAAINLTTADGYGLNINNSWGAGGSNSVASRGIYINNGAGTAIEINCGSGNAGTHNLVFSSAGTQGGDNIRVRSNVESTPVNSFRVTGTGQVLVNNTTGVSLSIGGANASASIVGESAGTTSLNISRTGSVAGTPLNIYAGPWCTDCVAISSAAPPNINLTQTGGAGTSHSIRVNQTVTQGGAAFIVVNTDGTTTNFAIRPDGSITLNANGIATLKTQLGIP